MPTILIVDDDPGVRKYLGAVLRDAGHRSLEAATGAEGLEHVRRERPDLVIADILMPAMSGFEFVQHVRADPATAQTRIILTTGVFLAGEVLRLAQECGVLHLLPKPFGRQEILQVVDQAVTAAPPVDLTVPPGDFDREHVHLLTNKLMAKVEELHATNQRLEQEAAERQRAGQALRESHSLLHAVIEGIPDPVYVKDLQGRYILLNAAGTRLVGRAVAAVLGWDDTALFDPETARRFMETDRQVMEGGAAASYEETSTAAGVTRTYFTTRSPLRGRHGEVVGVLGVSWDITERKQAEETLKENAARLRTLSRRLVEVQEDERRHLARELHDEIGQLLTSLKFALEASASAPSETAGVRLREAQAQIEEALNRVRELSFDLRPALLDHLGLLPALRALIERYTANTGVRVNMNHAVLERRFAPELETAAYRIVQEALTNVARHAGVSDAVVRLWLDADTLRIQVEDEGVGFDPAAALAASRSSGLPGMYERVLLLGGRLVIESRPGTGTHLLAELPLSGQTAAKVPERSHRLGR